MYNIQSTIDRINGLLRSHGKEKQALNDYCHISKNTINSSCDSRYGLGASILYDIADFLDCSVDYLLGRDDVPKAAPSDLSSEEVALIEMYRELSPKEQGMIYGKIETLCEMRQAEYKKDGA